MTKCWFLLHIHQSAASCLSVTSWSTQQLIWVQEGQLPYLWTNMCAGPRSVVRHFSHFQACLNGQKMWNVTFWVSGISDGVPSAIWSMSYTLGLNWLCNWWFDLISYLAAGRAATVGWHNAADGGLESPLRPTFVWIKAEKMKPEY